MRRTTALWEMFVTRFEDALDRHKKGRLKRRVNCWASQPGIFAGCAAATRWTAWTACAIAGLAG